MTPQLDATTAGARVALVPVDEAVLAELVLAATTDADPDEVTPALGRGWTAERVDWLRAFHRDRRAGLAGGDEETSAVRVADTIVGATRLHRVRPELPDELEYGVWFVRAVRGRGLSRVVFELAVARAMRAGALRLIASTTMDNEPAVRSLRRAGAALSVRVDGSVLAVVPLTPDLAVE